MIMEKFLTLPNLPVVRGVASGPVPLANGTTSGTADGFLVDTTATFATDVVVAGDVVVNITSGATTTVLTTATVDGANLAIANAEVDFFETGDAYRIMLAADANKLVDTGTSFTTDVSPGDVVLNGVFEDLILSLRLALLLLVLHLLCLMQTLTIFIAKATMMEIFYFPSQE
jgi:hypothetical protein